MLKNLNLILAGICLCTSGNLMADNASAPEPTLKFEARTAIQSLASSLGKELKTTAKQHGLPAAIEVCNTKAGPVTQQVSDKHNWQISRTSLKLRNPSNAPDAWEQAVLEKFAQQASQGTDLKKLAYSEVITDSSGQKTFRLMKAIPVGQQCLACHGSQLTPEISSKLQHLYPEDQATGFSVGDLRGAFSLKKTL